MIVSCVCLIKPTTKVVALLLLLLLLLLVVVGCDYGTKEAAGGG
jgi:hypothetical protein